MAMPAVRQARMPLLIGAGAILGLAYTLSPLTILSLAALAWATTAASRGLSESERRWYWSILVFSIAIRLLAIATLFYTANPAHPFASFFGDEELYKFRAVWLRNIGQGLPMSPADVIYTFDDVGHTSYIYVLALLQAFVGDAPYGLHVLNMSVFLCGVLVFYRLARASYGRAVGMAGLIFLLCLPSLSLWSVSVLKEPVNVLMIAIELVAAVIVVRGPHWAHRVLALIVIALSAVAMESLRTGGVLTAVFGTLVGVLLAFVLSRGRRLAIAMVAAPLAIALVASLPPVQDRVLARVRDAAKYHAGHIQTPGYSYQLVHPRYYADRNRLVLMTAPEAARYTVKALWAYVSQPLPRERWSRSLLAYVPEQVIWWAIAALLPFGIYAGFRRDIVVTAMLASHALAAIAIVALSSGNIGTLIRHRSLALPYVIWLAAVGAHEGIRIVASGRLRSAAKEP
jgi:hypothetical protein